MIQRFNFYDLYGYFLPGLLLLTLIWLPFGLIAGYWPAKEISSALVTFALAYIAGHLMQTFAVNALPSKSRDAMGKPRFRSDIFLDKGDHTFSQDFKERLARQIKTRFGIDVKVMASPSEPPSRERQDAFFLCRSALIKVKSVSYGEQFQGMYALMRGLTLAFWAGSVYHAGWAAPQWKSDRFTVVAVGFAALVLLAACITEGAALLSIPQKKPKFRFARLTLSAVERVQKAPKSKLARLTLGAVGLVLLSLGYVSGHSRVVQSSARLLLAGISLASLFLGLTCLGGYGYFAKEFAMAIYRDFCAYEETQEGAEQE